MLNVYLDPYKHGPLGWALNEDFKQIQQALRLVKDVKLCPEKGNADILEFVYWEDVLSQDPSLLKDKKIICHLSGEPFRYLKLANFNRALDMVDMWVSQSKQAKEQLDSVGIPNFCIPYTSDPNVFKKGALVNRYSLPFDKYLIGNFHRDSVGGDLYVPKLVKGPDMFLEMVVKAHENPAGRDSIHVVLAGPRRHWLRQQLEKSGIPYTFCGKVTSQDDMHTNVLSHEDINMLYNLIDLYVISSRSEGGPRSTIEAGLSKCAVISTPVGLAQEVLNPKCIYRSVIEASDLIIDDIRKDTLRQYIDEHYRACIERHTSNATVSLYQNLYHSLPTKPKTFNINHSQQGVFSISLWHKFQPSPYGGGNQFMTALRKYLEKQKNIKVVVKDPKADVHIISAVQFEHDIFLDLYKSKKMRVIHRVDGPIYLPRKCDLSTDQLCASINAQVASKTVFQSSWSFQQMTKIGLNLKSPIIIPNFVDPEIFNRKGKAADYKDKIHLISTSWSNGLTKGLDTYKWLDENLDWSVYTFTFVGNIKDSSKFRNIKIVEPVDSEKLSGMLKEHHIFVAPSIYDSCSNSVLEAMACGLPVVYCNGTGHTEIVGYGGLSFESSHPETIPSALKTIAGNYTSFQKLIVIPNVKDVVENYLAICREIL